MLWLSNFVLRHEGDAIHRLSATPQLHLVARLDPKPDKTILDLATETGWTSRFVA
jgi:hypothetical protein